MVSSLSHVVHGWADAGKPHRASRWLSIAVEEKLPLPHAAWKAVVDSFSKVGDTVEAARWRLAMHQHGSSVASVFTAREEGRSSKNEMH